MRGCNIPLLQCFSTFPPPPYFPSDLHGHLAALAGTTGVFPLGRLVTRLPACLPVNLPVCLPPYRFSASTPLLPLDVLSYSTTAAVISPPPLSRGFWWGGAELMHANTDQIETACHMKYRMEVSQKQTVLLSLSLNSPLLMEWK